MSTQGANPSVLIAGDDLDTASFVESSLDTLGFEVVRAVNGMEALVHLRSRPFDVILCEFKMPGLGGEELYAVMEKDCPWAIRNLCFLVHDLNGLGVQAFLRRTEARYLMKPFSFDQLAGVINEILAESAT